MKGWDDVYDMESNAFQGMHSQDHPRIVKYLGEYHFSGVDLTHHIILEYGDQDLGQYLATRSPPVLNEDIIAFWKGLFDVAKALRGIHRFQHMGEDGITRELKG